MPKLACRCGYVMNLSITPANYEFALVPETLIEKVAEKLDDSQKITGQMFFELIDEVRITIYCCPSCGRFHINEGGGKFGAFVREQV